MRQQKKDETHEADMTAFSSAASFSDDSCCCRCRCSCCCRRASAPVAAVADAAAACAAADRDMVVSRSPRIVSSIVVAAYASPGAAPHQLPVPPASADSPAHAAPSQAGRGAVAVPLVGVYLTYPHTLPESLLQGLLVEMEALLSLLGPLLHALLHSPAVAMEWELLQGVLEGETAWMTGKCSSGACASSTSLVSLFSSTSSTQSHSWHMACPWHVHGTVSLLASSAVRVHSTLFWFDAGGEGPLASGAHH